MVGISLRGHQLAKLDNPSVGLVGEFFLKPAEFWTVAECRQGPFVDSVLKQVMQRTDQQTGHTCVATMSCEKLKLHCPEKSCVETAWASSSIRNPVSPPGEAI